MSELSVAFERWASDNLREVPQEGRTEAIDRWLRSGAPPSFTEVYEGKSEAHQRALVSTLHAVSQRLLGERRTGDAPEPPEHTPAGATGVAPRTRLALEKSALTGAPPTGEEAMEALKFLLPLAVGVLGPELGAAGGAAALTRIAGPKAAALAGQRGRIVAEGIGTGLLQGGSSLVVDLAGALEQRDPRLVDDAFFAALTEAPTTAAVDIATSALIGRLLRTLGERKFRDMFTPRRRARGGTSMATTPLGEPRVPIEIELGRRLLNRHGAEATISQISQQKGIYEWFESFSAASFLTRGRYDKFVSATEQDAIAAATAEFAGRLSWVDPKGFAENLGKELRIRQLALREAAHEWYGVVDEIPPRKRHVNTATAFAKMMKGAKRKVVTDALDRIGGRKEIRDLLTRPKGERTVVPDGVSVMRGRVLDAPFSQAQEVRSRILTEIRKMKLAGEAGSTEFDVLQGLANDVDSAMEAAADSLPQDAYDAYMRANDLFRAHATPLRDVFIFKLFSETNINPRGVFEFLEKAQTRDLERLHEAVGAMPALGREAKREAVTNMQRQLALNTLLGASAPAAAGSASVRRARARIPEPDPATGIIHPLEFAHTGEFNFRMLQPGKINRVFDSWGDEKVELALGPYAEPLREISAAIELAAKRPANEGKVAAQLIQMQRALAVGALVSTGLFGAGQFGGPAEGAAGTTLAGAATVLYLFPKLGELIASPRGTRLFVDLVTAPPNRRAITSVLRRAATAGFVEAYFPTAEELDQASKDGHLAMPWPGMGHFAMPATMLLPGLDEIVGPHLFAPPVEASQ